MQKTLLIYPFKVWVFVLFVSPLLAIWIDYFQYQGDTPVSWLIGGPLALGLAGVFTSLPGMGIYFIAYYFLVKKSVPVVWIKFLLTLIAVGVVTGTIYYFISKEMLERSNRDGFLFFESYIATAVLATIFYKIRKRNYPNPVQ